MMRRNDTASHYDTRPISLGERIFSPDRRLSVSHLSWLQPRTNYSRSVLTLDPVRATDNDTYFLCQVSLSGHLSIRR